MRDLALFGGCGKAVRRWCRLAAWRASARHAGDGDEDDGDADADDLEPRGGTRAHALRTARRLRWFWIECIVAALVVVSLICVSLALEWGRERSWPLAGDLSRQETAVPLVIACGLVLYSLLRLIYLWPTVSSVVASLSSGAAIGGFDSALDIDLAERGRSRSGAGDPVGDDGEYTFEDTVVTCEGPPDPCDYYQAADGGVGGAGGFDGPAASLFAPPLSSTGPSVPRGDGSAARHEARADLAARHPSPTSLANDGSMGGNAPGTRGTPGARLLAPTASSPFATPRPPFFSEGGASARRAGASPSIARSSSVYSMPGFGSVPSTPRPPAATDEEEDDETPPSGSPRDMSPHPPRSKVSSRGDESSSEEARRAGSLGSTAPAEEGDGTAGGRRTARAEKREATMPTSSSAAPTGGGGDRR